MSIYDNIAFGPRLHGMSRQQMLERIEALQSSRLVEGLPDLAHVPAAGRHAEMDLLVQYYLRLAGLWDEVHDRLHDPAAKLSVGQQQRLALARTLAVEPDVILADEPTSALDPLSAKLIEKQFRLLKKEYTIVLVTHILRQARRIADYVIFLYLGELVEHGPVEQVLNAPKDDRTRAYVSGEIS
jgi:phosphate transport system ATP-binding protein